MKTPAFLPLLFVLSIGALAEDDLPKRGANDRMEFEPDLKLYEVKPEESGPTEPWAIPADIGKAQEDADRAQQKAARWQQMQKNGVLSKEEVEKAVLSANRAVYRLQQARAAAARKQVESIQARVKKGEASPDLLVSAVSALKVSEALAAQADELLRKTDVEFARNRLNRRQQLANYGLVGKGQVQRAETALEKAAAATPAPIPPPIMLPARGTPGVSFPNSSSIPR